jgi:hypothetical protein
MHTCQRVKWTEHDLRRYIREELDIGAQLVLDGKCGLSYL